MANIHFLMKPKLKSELRLKLILEFLYMLHEKEKCPSLAAAKNNQTYPVLDVRLG